MALDREFIEFIERYIPPGFFLRAIDEYEEDYSLAASNPYELFDEPEAHDLMGDERRARTESSLVHVARQFNHRGISAKQQLNDSFSHYHREISAGPVVLTSSFVSRPGELVAEARFRNTLARSRQLSLLRENAPNGDRLYGVILHGIKRAGKRRFADTLGFFQLAIPNRSCTAYEAIYNLPARYVNTEIDATDRAAAMEAGVPIDPVRAPSALIREYRRLANNGE